MEPTEPAAANSIMPKLKSKTGFFVATILLSSVLHGAFHWFETAKFEPAEPIVEKQQLVKPADKLKTIYVEARKRRAEELNHQFGQEYNWVLNALTEQARAGVKKPIFAINICSQAGFEWLEKMVLKLREDGFKAQGNEVRCLIDVDLTELEED